MRLKTILILLIFILVPISFSVAQTKNSSIKWTRKNLSQSKDLFLFHSTRVINLPTAETHQKGNLEFEVAHRFIPFFSDGPDVLYGLDGPANMNLSLSYAISNRILISLARSNVLDNLELAMRYKAIQFNHAKLPILIAAQGGASWNSEDLFIRSRGDSRNFQYYGQLIINTLWDKKIGFGVVPFYLHNTNIFSEKIESHFGLGGYLQFYFSPHISMLAEINAGSGGDPTYHNTGSFGIEFATGGHFFKIFATNSTMLNQTQYLAGSEEKFTSENLRLGFIITRIFGT